MIRRRPNDERPIAEVFAEDLQQEGMYIYLSEVLQETFDATGTKPIVCSSRNRALVLEHFRDRPYYNRLARAVAGDMQADVADSTDWEKLVPLFDMNPLTHRAMFVSMPDRSALPVEVFRVSHRRRTGLGMGAIIVVTGDARHPRHVDNVRRRNAETVRQLSPAKTLRHAMRLKTLTS